MKAVTSTTRFHCIHADGYNYLLSPYFVDLAQSRGVNVVAAWHVKEYRTAAQTETTVPDLSMSAAPGLKTMTRVYSDLHEFGKNLWNDLLELTNTKHENNSQR